MYHQVRWEHTTIQHTQVNNLSHQENMEQGPPTQKWTYVPRHTWHQEQL